MQRDWSHACFLRISAHAIPSGVAPAPFPCSNQAKTPKCCTACCTACCGRLPPPDRKSNGLRDPSAMTIPPDALCQGNCRKKGRVSPDDMFLSSLHLDSPRDMRIIPPTSSGPSHSSDPDTTKLPSTSPCRKKRRRSHRDTMLPSDNCLKALRDHACIDCLLEGAFSPLFSWTWCPVP
ncbi:uncharacterized protein UV8b_03443 [Ustilaginoidea virens]|uniref:Uncharacterized protein n=1 Tax=Ustilaginoidea virens TaxID=1159556 RepID=A0A8E5MGR7_USTVR|nr:uncharacterized protein UV8b_03443 [Ustilaginoidea virens]QUC19202.1 hypothetical protein UV8b_03443 [Ustilaginoidea virens]